MRLATRNGRHVLLSADKALDVETASDGLFSANALEAYERWGEFQSWARTIDVNKHSDAETFTPEELGPPVPRPSQIFAIGLNYADHADESKMNVPDHPLVFTKFASSLAGPRADVRVVGETVDWEVELVVIIGTAGRNISRERAWGHVAGLSVGQDISERTVQSRNTPAQFSLGKSFEAFAPMGPAVVTLDEVANRDDLCLRTVIIHEDGKEQIVQEGRTADLIFDVPELIARLSEVVELLPGDLIFTGTPAGVGLGREPKQFLQEGQTLVSTIDGLGELRNLLV